MVAVRVVLCVAVVSSGSVETTSRDGLLIQLMYYILTADSLTSSCRSSEQCRLTPLEKALSVLCSLQPLCTDSVERLTNTVASLIKQQVLPLSQPLPCCCY